ncbi:VIT and VWA domain-containing protein [Clostridium sp. FS41]|uniref:VIT and vWA domain-containing protein n=1 Tax=Clostridia TaxID=186801 RepID=UPI0005D34D5D|nr:VIT and VWA domain-containing protein [Clostridium sp. FS41]KJJ65942.1 vault protein inter-alpha-trypsin [Clostridium sp. FS41]
MKMKKKWLCVFFTLLLVLSQAWAVYGMEEEDDPDKTLAPYFFVEGADPDPDSFPLKETKVSSQINGVIADTYVTQTYINEGKTPINAKYIFPASTKASVHGMTMQIGNRLITARIKEKEEAREEFEEAKNQGKSASLLEQQRPNVFSMDVANVMPNDTVVIELHYTEMVVSTEGSYQFVFPTVTGPRYTSSPEDPGKDDNQWVSTPYLKEGKTPSGRYDIAVSLSTGVPVTDITCRSHSIKIDKSSASAARITLEDPEDFAGDRDFILDYKLTGQDVNCGLLLDQGEEENFFMLMIQPPKRYDPEDIPPREYIFLMDVSGSMYGFPLDTAKGLIKDLVTSLRDTDTFNLILFSGASSRMSPVSVPATAENIQRAVELIDRQEGGGGTEMAPALRDALAIPKTEGTSRSIITITDGYISGEKEIFGIISQNLADTDFFSFGIGDSVNRYLIDGIAKVGLGESFVVTDDKDALDTAKRFCTYIQAPLLTDIQVSYNGFEVYDVEPAALPTLFAQRPIVLFGKWRGEPGGSIQVTGRSGNRDYVQDIQVSQASIGSNPGISYLWARTMVENLTDYNTGLEEDDSIKKEVTQLGLKYSMMTPYTSFVAVMEEVRNPDGAGRDVDQPLPLPQGVSDLSVGGGYTIGSEPGTMILVPAATAIIAGNILIRSRKKGDAKKQNHS